MNIVPGKVVSINLSKRKHIPKRPIKEGFFKENFGLEGDVHSGSGDRQVSLLAVEAIREQGRCIKVKGSKGKELHPGDFAENITTQRIALSSLPLGTKLQIGGDLLLKITKIGKECHTKCAIYAKLGDCVMPKEGVFAKVIKSGYVRPGDGVEVLR